MDEGNGFWADVEVEQLPSGLFRGVLVMGSSDESPEDALRIPLAGEHETAEDARLATRQAIEAMSVGGQG